MISVSLSLWWSGLCLENEYTTTLLLSTALFLLICSCKWVIKKPRDTVKVALPPGPRGLPIVGNLPFLDPDLHVFFAKLSENYGPIFKLKLGSKLWIVISSPSLVREVLKDLDAIFANHDALAVGIVGSYGGVDMVWSPYGEQWRMLRRLCVQELLTNQKLDELYGLRRRGVQDMVSHTNSKVGQPVDIGEQLAGTMFQIITSMVWGGTLQKKYGRRVNLEFREFINEVATLGGEVNVSDLFPVLAKFDLQGKARKMKNLILWFDSIFDIIMDQRLKGERDGKLNTDAEKHDFLHVLLEFKDLDHHKTPFSMSHIKALILDMIVGGTRTSTTAIEWAMTQMLKHPDVMRKVQAELEQVVGINNIVEESHLHKLKFLNAVVREVLRLHPPTPLLLPRAPSESCIVGDYMVPKGATLIINAWAIQRDPRFWNDPLEFKPERFLESNHGCDYNGNNFSYVPFGSGRRVCVGIPLAERMVPFLLASMLHSFNWKMPEGIKIDLSGKFGLELKKKVPLVAIPTTR